MAIMSNASNVNVSDREQVKLTIVHKHHSERKGDSYVVVLTKNGELNSEEGQKALRECGAEPLPVRADRKPGPFIKERHHIFKWAQDNSIPITEDDIYHYSEPWTEALIRPFG